MNKAILQSKIKSTGMAYVCWFIFGFQFAYLNKWGLQLLFWFTLWGFGVWWFIEMFLIPGRVERYNANIYAQIEEIDKAEKRHDLAMMAALTNRSTGINTSKLSVEEKAKLFDSMNL
jgi:hypothetical protein